MDVVLPLRLVTGFLPLCLPTTLASFMSQAFRSGRGLRAKPARHVLALGRPLTPVPLRVSGLEAIPNRQVRIK